MVGDDPHKRSPCRADVCEGLRGEDQHAVGGGQKNGINQEREAQKLRSVLQSMGWPPERFNSSMVCSFILGN